MLGRFHELSLPTGDIRASVEFYERLGFVQATTADGLPHPYGVVSDGRLVLGLHQGGLQTACITYVRPDVAQLCSTLEALGIELALRSIGPDVFNEIGFTDPSGHSLRVIEARTYSPVSAPAAEPLTGYFRELSLPTRDFEAAQRFWEPLGFVALGPESEPYASLPLTSDYLDITFHAPATCPEPMLVFGEDDMSARIERVTAQGLALARAPAGLAPRANALLRAPEGTLLLLRTA